MGGKKKETKEKPLDKMTAKELREVAKDTQGITGAHAMNKAELLSAIKEARGIVDESKKKSSDVREIKVKIKELKKLRDAAKEADDQAKYAILRKKITRLKKKTRKAA